MVSPEPSIYSLRTCVENMVSQIFKKAEKRSISWHITHATWTQFRVAELGVGYGGWQVASAT